MCGFTTPLVCLTQLTLIFTYSEINIEFFNWVLQALPLQAPDHRTATRVILFIVFSFMFYAFIWGGLALFFFLIEEQQSWTDLENLFPCLFRY